MSSVAVKICGLTRVEDARAAVASGAWAIGFVFHPRSPRAITAAAVRELLEKLGPAKVRKVGVFVDRECAEIIAIVRGTGLDTVQLHGVESPEFCAELRASGVQVIKAVRPRNAEELAGFEKFGNPILADTYVAGGEKGGTGRTGDWELAGRIRAEKLILAGGLNAANVREAIRKVRPWGVDVSSGLELAPGIKCQSKMKEFFRQVRS